jgi:hypothetical protein
MFVIKTELQNAADACALAAARELDGAADAITRADAAGILIGNRNLINFQDEGPGITDANLTYSSVLSPNSTYNRIINPAAAEYVMCSIARPNIGMLFMGVLGIGNQRVSAYAVATLARGQTTCAVPVGLCKTPSGNSTSTPKWGLEIGQWYGGKFSSSHTPCLTGTTSGNFNWIDFSPPNGGANELKEMLEGLGQCELPPVGTQVGQTGMNNGLKAAWNTRFGIYSGSYNANNSPPDFTGIAYTNANFPSGQLANTWLSALGVPPDVYNGTPPVGSTAPNYETAKSNRDPYQASNPADLGGNPTILPMNGNPSHNENGQSRRLVISPIVDCQSLCASSSQTVPVLDYACVLMLSPMPNNPDNVWVEYLGLATDAGSPCSSYGLAGGNGPLVPVLVQ